MAGLFSLSNVRNRPRRSAFDLSSKVAFTAKVGEILPVYWKYVMPGDKFNLKHQHFTRTQPVNTSAYTRIREYYDWFYVPMHILWRHFPEVVTQMQKNVQHSASVNAASVLESSLPSIPIAYWGTAAAAMAASMSPNNAMGFARSHTSYKLGQYLRYGNANNNSGNTSLGTTVVQDGTNYSQKPKFLVRGSAFPLLAYNKFCEDYFRYSQWQQSSPYLWNIDWYNGTSGAITDGITNDYWNNETMFDLKYCNWNKDMFMGLVPDTQYGSVSTVNLRYDALNRAHTVTTQAAGTGAAAIPLRATPAIPSASTILAGTPINFDILSLRRGEALQRWKEIAIASPQNYRSQIKAHFGVDVGENMSGMSTYIGGSASSLDISEVVNTNLSADGVSNEAVIAGKGVGSNTSAEFFEAKDWGIVMCLYHAVPLLDYVTSAPDPQLLLNTNTDFPIPELDSIGMESLPVVSFCNQLEALPTPWTQSASTTTLGYLPRYYQWKTSVDYVLGSFTTTEKEWVAPLTSAYQKQLLANISTTGIAYNFFKVNPSVLNSIFVADVDSTWDTDQLLINCNFDVRVTRNLDYSGMPY